MADPHPRPPAPERTAGDPGQGRAPTTSREHMLVELVDEAGAPVGSASVAQAHTPPGAPHRAFSVLLLSTDGTQLLLQRRAAVKTRFALRWANACCGHPAPGESVTGAADQRLAEELGLTGIDLEEIGVHRYRALDPATDRVEDEYDHVLLGRLDPEQSLRPDPAEVAELSWVEPAELFRLLDQPEVHTPWLPGVVGALAAVAPRWGR